MRPTLFLFFVIPLLVRAEEFRNGPFDGQPFKPNVPVRWSFTNRLADSLTAYRAVDVKLPQSAISNAEAIGGFNSLNLIKSKDANVIEFRDRPGEHDFTKFLKMSAKQGWVKYYDRLASGAPVHGLPSLEDAEKLALRYFVQLGGNTNQTSAFPWPHNESTTTTFDKLGGRETGKFVDARSIRASRQIDGIPILGNDFTVTFGNDAKPSMIEMNWTPMEPVQRFRVATKDDIMALIKSGKSFIQVYPPPPEDITSAKSYTVKNVLPLYVESGSEGEKLIKPYGSLLVEADMDGKPVDFVVNCSITTDILK